MRFEGTKAYVATDDLKVAVNAAVTLERPLLVKGEPGTGKTVLALEIAKALNAPLIEWHVKSTTKALQGLYEYDAVSRPARQPARRRARAGHPQLHQARQALGRLRRRGAAGAADRRDRQGRHRVSQRSAARTRSHGVLRLRDRRDREGAPPPGRHHHLQQREGAAGRVPAPLLLPLHPLPRPGHHAGDHRRAFPRHQAAAGRRGAEAVLRGARGAGAEEEALDLRIARLAQALDGRGHRPGNLRERDPKKLIPPLHGALLKNEQDVHLFERLAFMARREGR